MDQDDLQLEFDALQGIIKLLAPLSEEAKSRILVSASTFLNVVPQNVGHSGRTGIALHGASSGTPRGFSDDRSISPKQFLIEKKPQSVSERVACLAYYLTHYRDTPHFANLEISNLNTEAAQPKMANAARDIGHAQTSGFLVAAAKGKRQLSAGGEGFVMALPDREAARAAMTVGRPKRKSKKTRSSGSSDNVNPDESN